MITAAIDTKGLQFMINGLQNALIGMGGDASNVVKDETRLLALEIMKQSGPKDKAKTLERISDSVKSRFFQFSGRTDFESNTGREGSTGVKWYRCDKDFLFGVAPDSDMRGASPQTLANIYYRAKGVQGKTRLVMDFKHPRQHQRVAITTRIMVSPEGLAKAIKLVQKSIGKLKASWFGTAKTLKTTIRAPKWVEIHMRGNKSSKSITDLSSVNSENSSITFGSKAVGVTKFDRAIQFAVDLRAKKVTRRMNLIMSGYSRDVAAGIRPRKHAKETHES